MKGVLDFVKARIIIVVLVVLMLAVLPTAWVISSGLNKKIVETQTKAYQDEKQKIQRAASVTYALPRISEAEPEEALTVSRAPNDLVTAWFETQRAERAEQIEAISGRVIEINSAGRERLIPEFPPPDEADQRTQQGAVLELARKITGDGRGYDRSAYDILFERMGAGMPTDPDAVAQAVADFEERELANYESRSGDPQAPQLDREELNKLLIDRRIGEYRRAARDISFYGSAAAVTGVVQDRGRPGPRGGTRSSAGGYSQILTSVPEIRPTLAQGYVWQWDYWFIEDLLRAISTANTDQAGDPTPVDQSVVKRVESINLHEFKIPATGGADPVSDFGGSRGASAAAEQPEPDTITGRKSGAGPYDIRRAEMTVILTPSRLLELLDAIKSTNLMTVTDLDLQEIDVWEHLREGYFYGDGEHVMRATIGIESVWLHDWTKDFMPQPVRQALGITEPATGDDDEG